jgi:hypothetical protein
VDKDDIIKMAREAGFNPVSYMGANLESFERFAALVAAHEREACAKVCDDIRRMGGYSAETPDWERGTGHCADAIRARGDT